MVGFLNGSTPKPENDDEDRWLKKTVSLPSLTKGNRPSMWQRAEGSYDDEADSNDSWLKKTVGSRSLPRPCARWASNADEEEDTYARRPGSCSSPCGEEDSWLKKTAGTRSIRRVKWNPDADEEEDAYFAPDFGSKGSKPIDKFPRKTKRIDLVEKEFAHLDKHRQLKSMLRDQRQMERSLSYSRHLVEKQPKNSKDPRSGKIRDQQNTELSAKRIGNHISGCSKSRQDLVELQKRMSFVCEPPPVSSVCSDLKFAFADMLHRH